MFEILAQVCVVVLLLLVSFVLAWLSRRAPAARTRRTPGRRLFLACLAFVSLLLPLTAALATAFFGGGSLWLPLSFLAGFFAIAFYLLPAAIRSVRSAARTVQHTTKNLYVRPARFQATRSVAHALTRRMLKRNSLRALHRHAWATVALVLTAISISLTLKISSVHVEGDSASRLKIAFDSAQPLLRPAVIRLSGGNGEPLSAQIDLRLKPGQSVQLAFSALDDAGCDNMDVKSMDAARISYSGQGATAFRLVNVEAVSQPSASKPGDPVAVSLYCKLDVTPFAETFAERSFEVSSMDESYFPHPEHNEPAAGGHVVDFRIEGASDITLVDDSISPVPLPDTQRWLASEDGHIVVRWHDTRSSEERDVLLVFIGGLLGLAASGFLEWVRPYIAPE